MPIFAGEPTPGNLYYVHRSLHDPELQAQLVVAPVTGAIITGNSIFADNISRSWCGLWYFQCRREWVSLVALLSGEQGDLLIYESVPCCRRFYKPT